TFIGTSQNLLRKPFGIRAALNNLPEVLTYLAFLACFKVALEISPFLGDACLGFPQHTIVVGARLVQGRKPSPLQILMFYGRLMMGIPPLDQILGVAHP